MRRIACLAALLILAGCGSGPKLEQAAFAGEPYPVRRVDRQRFAAEFRPARVPNTTRQPAGTLVVDTVSRHLYFVENDKTAMRYGIAVGKAGYAWKGRAVVGRKSAWPAWYPTDEMKVDAPGIPSRIPPGPDNPLGARALYLYQGGRDTLYRIHGTSEPWTIGTEASSGCIRMINEDIIELFDKVGTGTKVIVQ